MVFPTRERRNKATGICVQLVAAAQGPSNGPILRRGEPRAIVRGGVPTGCRHHPANLTGCPATAQVHNPAAFAPTIVMTSGLFRRNEILRNYREDGASLLDRICKGSDGSEAAKRASAANAGVSSGQGPDGEQTEVFGCFHLVPWPDRRFWRIGATCLLGIVRAQYNHAVRKLRRPREMLVIPHLEVFVASWLRNNAWRKSTFVPEADRRVTSRLA